MRFARVLFVLGVLGMSGCAAATSSSWDPQGAEGLKQEASRMLSSLDAGNFMALLDNADSNIVIFDFDVNNNPIRIDGIADARNFFTGMGEAAQSQGLKFTSTQVKSDAWATATMGFCVVEFDQAIAMGGQTMGPFKFRGTIVARREGTRWLMTHWHGSFRELPGAMADTSGAAPAH